MDFWYLFFLTGSSFIASLFGCAIWYRVSPTSPARTVRLALGFIMGWASIALTIIFLLFTQFIKYPEISIIAAGALAFCAAQLAVPFAWRNLSKPPAKEKKTIATPLPCPPFARIVSLAFSAFCLIATGIFLVRLISKDFNAFITPFIGWYCIFPYAGDFPHFLAWISGRKNDHLCILQTARGFVLLAILFGVLDYCIRPGAEHSENPFLFHHPYRPLFTILLPLIWLLLIQIAIGRTKVFQRALGSDDSRTIKEEAQT